MMVGAVIKRFNDVEDVLFNEYGNLETVTVATKNFVVTIGEDKVLVTPMGSGKLTEVKAHDK
jgi:hypothetical protein